MKINVSNWDLEAVFQFFEEQGGDWLEQDDAGQSWLHFDPQGA